MLVEFFEPPVLRTWHVLRHPLSFFSTRISRSRDAAALA
jgi:hypothetical protein